MGSVLQVLTATHRRGAEVFGVDLGAALAVRRHHVRTVALRSEDNGAGLSVDVLGPSRLHPTTLARLRRASQGVDIVVAHGSDTLSACGLATMASGTPFVYRSIGDPTYWSRTAARRWRVGVLLNRARAVVALWPGAADELARRFHVPPARIHVIPNAVAAARFEPVSPEARADSRARFGLDPGAPVVLCLGALSVEKGVDAAVRAVAQVPDAVLLVVGAGRERAAVERLADEVAPGRVRFTGSVPDPTDALAAADVLVMPSRTEGLPAAAIEAGMRGLPVVAFDVGGLREIVEHGRTGILVPAGREAQLAEALAAVLAQPGDMGALARKRCLRRFDMEVVADQWSALLTQLTS